MREVLGTMSGTSMDGVDAAVLTTDGRAIGAFGPRAFRPYAPAERAAIAAAAGRWPGDPGVAEAARTVEDAHAALLSDMPGALIGFHGQTLAHDPARRRTHQAGDGARLAAILGRPVAWGFRGADVAAGGQGAPLAPAFHFAAIRHAGLRGAAVLNLGGVANLTWIDAAAEAPEAPGAMLAFDTGPASALIDDMMRARLGRERDEGGALAASGTVDEALVERFLAHPFLSQPAPKSLDRDDFRAMGAAADDLADADAAATLTAIAAAGVAAGLALCPARPGRLLVAGGGRHNAALMAMIADRAGVPAVPVEEVGLDGDMLEAQAFAFLAARVAAGLPITFPGTTGVAAPMAGGRISRPDGP